MKKSQPLKKAEKHGFFHLFSMLFCFQNRDLALSKGGVFT